MSKQGNPQVHLEWQSKMGPESETLNELISVWQI